MLEPRVKPPLLERDEPIRNPRFEQAKAPVKIAKFGVHIGHVQIGDGDRG